jgi:dihydropteroate synthase
VLLVPFVVSDFLSMRHEHTWELPRNAIHLGKRTAIMGILNVTPDSFSDAGQYFDLEKAVARGLEMEQEGADIIDIGGESSRPGSEAVPEEEEVRRALPVIERLARVIKIPISIDTYRANVARRALEAGAQVVNDISAFRFDERMPEVVREHRAGVVLMHSRGARETLHKQGRMSDPIGEISGNLAQSAEQAVSAGIPAEAIAVDPGIGFGKSAEESVAILKSLNVFSKIRYPVLVGTSRKSFIRLMTSNNIEEARIWGTAATVVAAIMNGAHIVRVHDVRQTRVLADVSDRLV